ncbi:MAG: hypothetical protein CBC16_09685 [Verrucomicrobia bacterium TMED56]|nr:MAG: hypothetical protein CBC16_09685 [Verrucomicrobia bacterium TMED56]
MNKGVEMLKNKKQFYITELEMSDDGDGLEFYSDHSGPFTLSKARKIMEKMFKSRSGNNFYNLTIRGPRHMNGYGHNTEFYSHREDR